MVMVNLALALHITAIDGKASTFLTNMKPLFAHTIEHFRHSVILFRVKIIEVILH